MLFLIARIEILIYVCVIHQLVRIVQLKQYRGIVASIGFFVYREINICLSQIPYLLLSYT